jgi:hypothetical protein
MCSPLVFTFINNHTILMRITIHRVLFALCACFVASCSSARDCSQENNYRIDYFTGGGFTGFEKGMTIECSGWVKLWEKKLNSPREITDSLLLKSSDRKKFDEIMNDTALFEYSAKEVSNHTATLIISKREKTTTIAYRSSDAPPDLPAVIRDLLTEITKIHK